MEAAAGSALHTGVKLQQILEIAALHGKLRDRFVGEDAVECGIGGISQRAFGGHLYRFGRRSRLQLQIHAHVARDFEDQLSAERLLESSGLCGDCVRTRLKVWSDIFARSGCDQMVAEIRGGIGDRDIRTANYGAALVLYRA